MFKEPWWSLAFVGVMNRSQLSKRYIYIYIKAKDNEEKNNKTKLKLGLAEEKRINHERVVGVFVEI